MKSSNVLTSEETFQLIGLSICPFKLRVSQKYLLGLFPSNFVEAIENSTNHAGSAEPQKKDDQNERVVVKVDEKLLDSTLYAVESVDPTIEDDEPGMIKNEQICKQMGKSLFKKKLLKNFAKKILKFVPKRKTFFRVSGIE